MTDMGLDVDVLAAAIFETERPGDWPTWDDYIAAFGTSAMPPWRRKAQRLIAEYARRASVDGERRVTA